MTPLEERRQALDKLTREALPLIKEVSVHTRKARKAMDEPVNTLVLSNELVELAILNQRLGERVAYANYLTRDTKNFYEETREEHKTRLVNEDGVAAGVADSMKVKLSRAEFEVRNEAELLYERLQFLRKSTDKTIDAIRSKLSYEKGNERNA